MRDKPPPAHFTGDMEKRGTKPNRSVEGLLHHTPVDGMIDEYLLSEIRLLPGGNGEVMASAERTALRMSWYLHSIAGRKVGGI